MCVCDSDKKNPQLEVFLCLWSVTLALISLCLTVRWWILQNHLLNYETTDVSFFVSLVICNLQTSNEK